MSIFSFPVPIETLRKTRTINRGWYGTFGNVGETVKCCQHNKCMILQGSYGTSLILALFWTSGSLLLLSLPSLFMYSLEKDEVCSPLPQGLAFHIDWWKGKYNLVHTSNSFDLSAKNRCL